MIPRRNDSPYHHAYVIHSRGSLQATRSALNEWILAELGITRSGNPNYIEIDTPALSIDMVRTIHAQHADRPFMNGTQEQRVWVISTASIPHESQNALLKILEEPKPHNTFFIIMNTVGTLLPTLVSRIVIVEHGVQAEGNAELIELGFPSAQDFVEATAGNRLNYVAGILKKYESEKIHKGHIRSWCESLLSVQKTSAAFKKALITVLTTIEDRGASPKILLEYLALQ